MPFRSDLALEVADSVLIEQAPISGISVSKYVKGGFAVSDIKISDRFAAEKIGKPLGRYLTLEVKSTLDESGSLKEDAKVLSSEIKRIIGTPKRVLAVGLGNSQVTPDSLGTSAADRIIATRHLDSQSSELRELFGCSVSVIKPGVMGATGLESLETVRAAIGAVKPDLVVLIDAFACGGVSRMGGCVQISDVGISPGSGVMNSRAEISQATTGVKCIAIGVPTMCDSKETGMMVTPKNIDRLIRHSSKLLAYGINMSLHPELDIDEIELLSE